MRRIRGIITAWGAEISLYIHNERDWPYLHWEEASLAEPLAEVRHAQGRLLGRMEALGFPLQQDATLDTLTQDVLKTSEIEGEQFDPDQVRSSVARHLGLEAGGLAASDRHIDGVVEMMLDATRHYAEPLTAERLFGWHALLFPEEERGPRRRLRVGGWRDDSSGPMQVVSGAYGRERVHYEAPAAARLEAEMTAFLRWFNQPEPRDWVTAAAIAHLWFVTIHPFDDGNGRIARAIADMALGRSEQSPRRFYSMSSQIRTERSAYYSILEQTQRGLLDVTPWMQWFVGCLGRSIHRAQTALAAVQQRERFWRSIAHVSLNARQRLMLEHLLRGFAGKLTTTKWAALAKCSQDTALRDIQPLLEHGILLRSPGGGRSTGYELAAFA